MNLMPSFEIGFMNHNNNLKTLIDHNPELDIMKDNMSDQLNPLFDPSRQLLKKIDFEKLKRFIVP